MQTASFDARGICQSCGHLKGTVKTTRCGWCDEPGAGHMTHGRLTGTPIWVHADESKEIYYEGCICCTNGMGQKFGL